MLDVLIRGALVCDGTGAAPFSADAALKDGKIAGLGHFPGAEAALTVDAAGRCLTPGFLDIHRHADAAAFRPGFGAAELAQGLTTIVNGNCGLSAAPLSGPDAGALRQYLLPITGELPDGLPNESMADYLGALARAPLPLNVGMLAGGGTVRASVCGFSDRSPDDGQFRAIRDALARALADGALGVSLGLGYAPECFYSARELVRALEPLRGGSAPITVHMRQEGDGMLGALDEMLAAARELRAPVHISHLKAMGRENWNCYAPEALRHIARAREEGLDVSCDVYPYTAGSTQLVHILPPEFLPGGTDAICARLRDPVCRTALAARLETGSDFENIVHLAGWEGILVTGLRRPQNAAYENRSLAEIASMRGETPLDACCGLLAEERCSATMIDFMANEGDISTILRAPFTNVISDATYPSGGRLHPRVYGTFPRVLERFVRKLNVLTLPEAVAKMTSVPANVLGLRNKGRAAAGCDADLLLFDPAAVRETATYAEPERLAAGMDYVFVNGRAAVSGGKPTGSLAGRVLRGA